MDILLLSGSFHVKSKTLALLNVIEEELRPHHAYTFPINTLPFYSEDITGDSQPEVVTTFITHVENSDGIIFCTPEYNHSIPAVLKNAIDWASRPAFNSPLKAKPVTIITQANSSVGGARAQAHLKLILDSTLSSIHSTHEMMVTNVEQLFDATLTLTDEKTRSRIKKHVDHFIDFSR